jgi:hypothetical protein
MSLSNWVASTPSALACGETSLKAESIFKVSLRAAIGSYTATTSPRHGDPGKDRTCNPLLRSRVMHAVQGFSAPRACTQKAKEINMIAFFAVSGMFSGLRFSVSYV